MNTQTPLPIRPARTRIIAIALGVAAMFGAALPSALMAADPTSEPEATLTPAEAACESADDLGFIVEFLRETDASEDGWLPVLVGAIAGLSEGRQLAGLVADTYRPLVDDIVVSFEGLGATVDELSEEETLGAKVAEIGVAITDIGTAMDALSSQLQATCPTD